MSNPSDQISLRARILWHIAFYMVALPTYLLPSDGEGRYERVMRPMVIFWPVLAAVDVLLAVRKGRRG